MADLQRFIDLRAQFFGSSFAPSSTSTLASIVPTQVNVHDASVPTLDHLAVAPKAGGISGGRDKDHRRFTNSARSDSSSSMMSTHSSSTDLEQSTTSIVPSGSASSVSSSSSNVPMVPIVFVSCGDDVAEDIWDFAQPEYEDAAQNETMLRSIVLRSYVHSVRCLHVQIMAEPSYDANGEVERFDWKWSFAPKRAEEFETTLNDSNGTKIKLPYLGSTLLEDYQNVVFVAYGSGGTFVKYLLDKYPDLRSLCQGVSFLSTLHCIPKFTYAGALFVLPFWRQLTEQTGLKMMSSWRFEVGKLDEAFCKHATDGSFDVQEQVGRIRAPHNFAPTYPFERWNELRKLRNFHPTPALAVDFYDIASPPHLLAPQMSRLLNFLQRCAGNTMKKKR